jgi:putative ABC transport system permease protein
MFDGIRILTWIVGLGTLLAGVIGVSNIMLVIVRERTQEIGIMRAIGATPRKVIGQIMLESVFITAVAGYIGMFVGIFMLEGLNYVLEMAAANGGEGIFIKNPEVNLTVAVSCLLVLIVSGAIAGYIPARRAVAIKTIDALRAE